MTAAVELASLAGVDLDERQRTVLAHIQRPDSDGHWVVPGARQVGEAAELYWLFLTDEKLIVHSAHRRQANRDAFERLEQIIRRTPSLHERVARYRRTNGAQEIELRDGRRLIYTNRSGLRGVAAGKLVLDGADYVTGENLSAILPVVASRNNWQVLTVGGPGASYIRLRSGPAATAEPRAAK